jgi:hypothetical protein
MRQLAGTTTIYDSETQGGLIMKGWKTDSGAPAATAGVYAVGAEITSIISGITYKNEGTVASPSWQNSDQIATGEIADSAVTYAKRAVLATATSTADGTGTGAIADGSTFVTVTSASATNQIALPAIVAGTIGQIIDIFVGANGYELITPASSNNTINTVDSDGTNQLDVAASTLLRCVQVSATGWYCTQIAATTITVVAPDND